MASCTAKGWADCTDGNTYCVDERYRWDCDFGTDLDGGDRGNGYCNQYINTEACDYDNGGSTVTAVRGIHTSRENEGLPDRAPPTPCMEFTRETRWRVHRKKVYMTKTPCDVGFQQSAVSSLRHSDKSVHCVYSAEQ